jgi:hypothetical protein
MTSKPDEMEAEADAILRVLELALGNRASRSAASFHEPKVRTGANRLRDAARAMRARRTAEEGRAGE